MCRGSRDVTLLAFIGEGEGRSYSFLAQGFVTSRWNYFMQGNMYVPLRRCTFYFILLCSYVTLHVGQSSRFSDVSIEADLYPESC